MAYRVIADHIRTVTFALSDGALFSNNGRGYVLRRVLRRAIRYGLKLGIDEAFMYNLVSVVAENMKDYYPYLLEKVDYNANLIKIEEETFHKTLKNGEKLLNEEIANAKSRMFRQLAEEVMNLVRIQFIISVVIFFLCITLLPYLGFGGLIMKIYPCLAVGYFILFIMYAVIIFQYYYNDLTGALLTSTSFWLGTLFGSIFATHLQPIWYGIGLVIGALLGWTVAYFRMRYIEKTVDTHIFCCGSIMNRGQGVKPSNVVYSKYAMLGKKESR